MNTVRAAASHAAQVRRLIVALEAVTRHAGPAAAVLASPIMIVMPRVPELEASPEDVAAAVARTFGGIA